MFCSRGFDVDSLGRVEPERNAGGPPIASRGLWGCKHMVLVLGTWYWVLGGCADWPSGSPSLVGRGQPAQQAGEGFWRPARPRQRPTTHHGNGQHGAARRTWQRPSELYGKYRNTLRSSTRGRRSSSVGRFSTRRPACDATRPPIRCSFWYGLRRVGSCPNSGRDGEAIRQVRGTCYASSSSGLAMSGSLRRCSSSMRRRRQYVSSARRFVRLMSIPSPISTAPTAANTNMQPVPQSSKNPSSMTDWARIERVAHVPSLRAGTLSGHGGRL